MILSINVNNMAARPAATMRKCSVVIKTDSIGQKKSVEWGGFVEGTSVGATNSVALLDAKQVGNEEWRRNDRPSV